MNHFGLAFGLITATVIGGALVLDHTLNDGKQTVARPVKPPASLAKSNAAPVAAVENTDSNGEGAAKLAEAGNAVSEAPKRAAPKTAPQETDGGKATKTSPKNTARSSRSSASNAELALTPAPAAAGPSVNVETPPSSVAVAPSTALPAPSAAAANTAEASAPSANTGAANANETK